MMNIVLYHSNCIVTFISQIFCCDGYCYPAGYVASDFSLQFFLLSASKENYEFDFFIGHYLCFMILVKG